MIGEGPYASLRRLPVAATLLVAAALLVALAAGCGRDEPLRMTGRDPLPTNDYAGRMDLAFQQVLATTPASQGKFTLHFVELLTPEDAAELVSTAAPEATVTAFAVVAGAYKGVVSVRAASPQSLPELFDTEVAREAAALDESVEDEQDQSLKAELQSYSAVLRARRNLVAAVEVTTTAQEINDVRGLVWFVAPLGFAQGGVLVRPERRND